MTAPLPVSRTGATDREVEAGGDALHDDLVELLTIFGLGTHARPYSPREVMLREIIPAARAAAAPASEQPEVEKAAVLRFVQFLVEHDCAIVHLDLIGLGAFTGAAAQHDATVEHWANVEADAAALLAEQPGGGR